MFAAPTLDDGIYIAEDLDIKARPGAKRYAQFSWPSYVNYVAGAVRSGKPLYHNEILTEGSPVRVYLDVERELAGATTEGAAREEAEADFKALMLIVSDFLQGKLAANLKMAAPVILEGSRPKKFSRHVIFPVKVANTAVAKDLIVRQFLAHLERRSDWTRERSMIDTKVYTKNRCFRLMHSSKRSAARFPLRWLNPDGSTLEGFNRARFEDSLVSRPAAGEPEIVLSCSPVNSTPTKRKKRHLRPTTSPDPKRQRRAPTTPCPSGVVRELESKTRDLFPCRLPGDIKFEEGDGNLHQVRVLSAGRKIMCPFGKEHNSNTMHVKFRVSDKSLCGVYCYGCNCFCEGENAVQKLKELSNAHASTENAKISPDYVADCLGFELANEAHAPKALGKSWSVGVREKSASGRACLFTEKGPRHAMLLMCVDEDISIECVRCRKRQFIRRTACFMDLSVDCAKAQDDFENEIPDGAKRYSTQVGLGEYTPKELAQRVHAQLLDDSQRSILFDWSNMGVGKTQTNLLELVRGLIEIKPDARILIEVSRRSLGMSIQERLRRGGCFFKLYSDVTEKHELRKVPRLIMQVDSSIHLTSSEPWDMIIVDEGTAHLKQFLSDNIDAKSLVLDLAKMRWAEAKRLVVLCADMTKDIASIYTKLFKAGTRSNLRVEVVHLRVLKPSQGIHNDYVSEEEARGAVAMALLTPSSRANLWMCSNSLQSLMAVEEHLIKEANKPSVQKRFGDQFEQKICQILNGIFFITGDIATTSSADRKQAFVDLNIAERRVAYDKEYIFDSETREFRRRGIGGNSGQPRRKYPVRLFACSPSMTVGVSYDHDKHFDACIAILSSSSPCPARDVSQMVNRVRKFRHCLVGVRESASSRKSSTEEPSYSAEDEARRVIAAASTYITTVSPPNDDTYLEMSAHFMRECQTSHEFGLGEFERVRRNNPGNSACVPDPQAIFMSSSSDRKQRRLRRSREWALLAASVRPLPLDLNPKPTTDYWITLPGAPQSEAGTWTEERIHVAKQHSALLALLGHQVRGGPGDPSLRPVQIAFLSHLRPELRFIRTLWYGTRSSDETSRKIKLWGRHLDDFNSYAAADLIFFYLGLSKYQDTELEMVARLKGESGFDESVLAERRAERIRALLILTDAYTKKDHGQFMQHPKCMTQDAPALKLENVNMSDMTFAYSAVHRKQVSEDHLFTARQSTIKHFRFWMCLLSKLVTTRLKGLILPQRGKRNQVKKTVEGVSVNMPSQLDQRKLGLMLAALQEGARGFSLIKLKEVNGQYLEWPAKFTAVPETDIPDVIQEELDKSEEPSKPEGKEPDAAESVHKIKEGVKGTQCTSEFGPYLARHAAMLRNRPEVLIGNETFDTLVNSSLGDETGD